MKRYLNILLLTGAACTLSLAVNASESKSHANPQSRVFGSTATNHAATTHAAPAHAAPAHGATPPAATNHAATTHAATTHAVSDDGHGQKREAHTPVIANARSI